MEKKKRIVLKSLRPYQQQAIANIGDNLQAGVDKQLLCMATGLGKTFTAVKVIEQLNFRRTLWLTHREELVEQSAMAFIRDKFDESLSSHIEEKGFINYVRQGGLFAGGNFKMGLIKADVFKPDADVVIASAQTLHRRLDLIDPLMYDCLVADEAHFFGSKSFFAGLDHFKPKLRLGLSATPYRADGVVMGDIFDKITFEYNIGDGIRDGYLAELDGIRIKTQINLDNVHTVGGEFNQKELSEEVNCEKRNRLVAESYLKYAKGRQGIFFCVDIQHCLDLLTAFKELDINADVVSSDEGRTGDRKAKIKAFKEGKIDVLINVEILTTGFDAPNVGVIGMACPTKSLVKYLQSCGRGTRLKGSEFITKYGQNCIILDFVDQTSRHNIINTWTLDKQLPAEQRVFITQEKRDKLIEARNARIEAKHAKDERVQLIPIRNKPTVTSIRSTEAATEKQLAFLLSLGYDIEGTVYTKKMVNEILDQLPARKDDLMKLKGYGFDISSPINRGQASYNIWMYEQKYIKPVRK